MSDPDEKVETLVVKKSAKKTKPPKSRSRSKSKTRSASKEVNVKEIYS